MTTATFYTPVQNSILQVETRMRDVTNGHHPDLGAALEHLLSSGGKRVRPAVALLTGAMLGADDEKIISLAASIELLHTATLVHDDLIDGALLRRGFPTLNAQWTPGATVLTGDFIFACAAKLAAQTDSVELMHLFAETLATIVNGEITQMFPRQDDGYYDEYLKRIYAKTGSLFVLATTAPAILSSIRESTFDTAQRFGYGIGMAFQITDDVLDFTGKQSSVGKPVASDLRQGLVTLPTIYYREKNPDDQNLDIILCGKNIKNENLNQLVGAIQSSGAIERSMNKARQFVNQALEALDELPLTAERRALENLANYIVDRRI
ncbi:MAG: polyprenyl synthetase family protein [Chloroflexi bacterium]|nr:polyprenyl synthetase family protein [Chloroflexota bacterium]